MRRTFRAALAAFTLLAVVAPPAHAQTAAVVLVGEFHYVPGDACYPYCLGGTGRFWATGTHTGPVDAYYTHWEQPGGVLCAANGAMYGTLTGAIDVDFIWTRVGTVAIGTVSGQITGTLFGQVTPFTDPSTCSAGEPVDVTAVIEIAGI